MSDRLNNPRPFQPSPNNLQLFLLTVGLVIGGLLVGTIPMILLGIVDGEGANPNASPQQMRIGVLLNHLLAFAIPCLIALSINMRKDWYAAIGLDLFPNTKTFFTVLLFALAALPIVAFSIWVNLQFDLPDWAQTAEQNSAELLGKVLDMDSPLDLLLAILAAGVAAGVGEELLFRGILQGKIFSRLNHHLAIWISAILFSAIHFELAGFLPRLLLGAILGYSYWWSRSLWIPILFHTLFNGSQVIATYISGEYTPDTEAVDLPSPVLTILSLIAVVMLGIFLERDMDNTPPSGAPLVEEEALEQV